MRLICPSCTSIHPFWSRPFAVSHSIIPVRAVVSGLRPCPACALRRHSHAGTQLQRCAQVGSLKAGTGQLRSAQPAHNRCERAGTETRAALFELVPAPLPLFSKAQDPLPHRSHLPGYNAPPSPLVLDGDRPPCSPSLFFSQDSYAALLRSSPGGGCSGGGCGSPGSAHPTRPWSCGDRGRRAARQPGRRGCSHDDGGGAARGWRQC